MNDVVYRQNVIDAVNDTIAQYIPVLTRETESIPLNIAFAIKRLPCAEPTLREKALSLLVDWSIECGFGYDNMPEEYAIYEKDIENMSYKEGLIYIAEMELEGRITGQ